MGFVKRYIELEEYLIYLKIEWQLLSDLEYRQILQTLDRTIHMKLCKEYEGDDAFSMFKKHLPFDGYIFSAPKHEYFSVYESGGINLTFGYAVKDLMKIDREKINSVECVIADSALSFCCVFNHEWQSMAPERFFDLSQSVQ